MLTVCWFKWLRDGYRTRYEAWHVNAAFQGFARHYPKNFEPVCITDDPEGLHPDIRYVPLWSDFMEMQSPHGNREPNCYPRLKLFEPDTARAIGERILWLDLDIVFTGDLRPLFDRPESIVLLPNPTNPSVPYNGSLVLMDAGCRPAVWEEFDPTTSPARNKSAQCAGSDQGQISYVLRGRGEAEWKVGPHGDGIYFFGSHLRADGERLPRDARLVSFHGKRDPWHIEAQRLAWVREHYPLAKAISRLEAAR